MSTRMAKLIVFFLIFLVLISTIVLVTSNEVNDINCDRGKIIYTESTRTVINDDCTMTTTLYSGIITYKNYTSDKYLPINNSLITSCTKQPLYEFCVEEGVYQAYFKQDPSTAQSIKYVFNFSEDYYSTYQPHSLNYRNDLSQIQQISTIQGVTGYKEDNKFIYPNAFGSGFNLSYTYVEDTMIKELVIDNITSLPLPAQYMIDGGNVTLDMDYLFDYPASLDVYINGTAWDKSSDIEYSDKLEFRKDENTTLFYIPKPYATDSDGNEIELTFKLKKGGSKIYIIVKTNYTWLQNAVYPVTIDPTITLQAADTENLEDAYIEENNADTNYGSNQNLYIGDELVGNGDTHSIIKFNITIGGLHSINTAILYIYAYSNAFEAGENANITVWELNNHSWNEDEPTWNKPVENIGNIITSNNSQLGSYIGWFTFNVTTFVISEHSSSYENASLYLNVTPSTIVDYLSCYSKEYIGDTSKRPYIVINYIGQAPEFDDGTNITAPATPNHYNTFWASVNVTDYQSDTIRSVNFTLKFPNGTYIFQNENATDADGNQNNSQWNSSKYIVRLNGTYNISVMATDENGYENWMYWLKTITYNTPYITNNHTNPNVNRYHARVNVSVDITDPDAGDSIKIAYLSVWAPNGTRVINNQNMTQSTTNWTSHDVFTIRNGTWNISVKAVDNHYNNNTFNWSINATWGTLNVTSPDNDKDWSISMKTGSSKTFNVTASHTGSLNNTVNVTISSNITDYFNVSIGSPASVEPATNTTNILINITANDTVVAKTYIGYLLWNRTDNDTIYNNNSILLNITVSTQSADLDIIETFWSSSKYDTEEKKLTFNIWNKGDYNATECDMDFSNSLSVAYSFNQTNFTVTNTTNVTVNMTLTGGIEGVDATTSVSIECTATSTGSKDSDALVGTLTILSTTIPPGGGGGGGAVIFPGYCGDFICDPLKETCENCPEDCGDCPIFEETPLGVLELFFVDEIFFGLNLFTTMLILVPSLFIINRYRKRKRLDATDLSIIGVVAVFVFIVLTGWFDTETFGQQASIVIDNFISGG